MGVDPARRGTPATPAEVAEDTEENHAWLGSSVRRPSRPLLLAALLRMREVLDRENISEAAAGELLRVNVVLRGDGRTVGQRPSIYIPYHAPDRQYVERGHFHLQMLLPQRQPPCRRCEQDNAEQE
jgi:hypothetical protein